MYMYSSQGWASRHPLLYMFVSSLSGLWLGTLPYLSFLKASVLCRVFQCKCSLVGQLCFSTFFCPLKHTAAALLVHVVEYQVAQKAGSMAILR